MKYIFLDIDGVLNNRLMYDGIGKIIKTSEGQIDERCVELLNKLTDDTGAKIVVSSTWRMFGLERVRNALLQAGVKGEIIDITPRSKDGVRGVEIHTWLRKHEHWTFDGYVILDDDSDMLLWQRENYFRVDAWCGLTPNVVYRATVFLNSKNNKNEENNKSVSSMREHEPNTTTQS